MEASWFEALDGGKIRCVLCPHRCELAEGRRGLCRIRLNRGGTMDLPAYGLIASMALDPIEKKPLYRFLPGSQVFSAGFYGCNLRCPFCQNWEISQSGEGQGRAVSPEELVALALASEAPSIAFTYSEPTVHIEYVREAAAAARESGLATVLVTNGNLLEGPARELLGLMDAVNLDIKANSTEVYRRRLAGDLGAVREFATEASRSSWLEVTTLVVPDLEEWEAAIDGITDFIAGLSPEIALHLSAYHPAWKHAEPPTQASLLGSLVGRARKGLRHVYEGNVAREGSDERCPSCEALLVSRRGWRVSAAGLVARPRLAGTPPLSPRAACAHCGAPAFFVAAWPSLA